MTAESDVEESPPDEIRSAREIAVRALALFAPIGVALGAPRAEVVPWLKEKKLWEELTSREVDFLANENPPERSVVNYSWQSERLVVLLWALGKVSSLPPSSQQCDTGVLQELLPPFSEEPVSRFVESARLRGTTN